MLHLGNGFGETLFLLFFLVFYLALLEHLMICIAQPLTELIFALRSTQDPGMEENPHNNITGIKIPWASYFPLYQFQENWLAGSHYFQPLALLKQIFY